MINSIKSAMDEKGWYNLLGEKNPVYSSLIGIPISGLPTVGNTTSRIETSYWSLDCPTMRELEDGFLGANQTHYNWEGFYLSSPTNRTGFWDSKGNIKPNAPARKLIYRGTFINRRGEKQYEYAECDITTSYVEVEVECSHTTCLAAKMRRSKSPTILSISREIASFNDRGTLDTPFQFPRTWTAFDGLTAWGRTPLIWSSFRRQLEALSTSSNIIVGGTSVQHYFQDPASPFAFDVNDMVLITALSRGAFAASLSQLLNTFWLAIVGRNVVSIGRAQSAVGFLSDPIYDVRNVLATTGAREETDVFTCHRGWFSVLVLATLTVFLACVAGIVLIASSKGPELAMNMTTVVRESGNVDVMGGGTALDDDERGRLLKNVEVRIGDVAPGEETGKIGIGAVDVQSLRVVPLSRSRLYR
jgi:hypothetical protein